MKFEGRIIHSTRHWASARGDRRTFRQEQHLLLIVPRNNETANKDVIAGEHIRARGDVQ